MIILCITDCPASLRGDLSKWLCEINTGVYVGKLNARVREELWERVCSHIKSGRATMVYPSNNEQGYTFLTHNTTWIPIDYEGITLMQKPLAFNDDSGPPVFLRPGFSKASRYEKARTQRKCDRSSSYVVIDIETTGLDPAKDRIIEIGLLKIIEDTVKDQAQCLVRSDKKIPDALTRLTGITDEMIKEQGISEASAFEKTREFIGDSVVVGYNVQFDLQFIQKLAERVGGKIVIKKAKDVLHIARRKIDGLEDHKLETVAAYFDLGIKDLHRALTDCMLTYRIFSELNEL